MPTAPGTVTTLEIPFDDFGGQGPVLHFATANAYPPGAYRRLLTRLAEHYRLLAMHHRPLWPDSQPDEVDDWQTFADDLIVFCEQQGLLGALGVGHSLGAVATMMAALKRPELFCALVLIEPVFLPPAILDSLRSLQTSTDPYETPLVTIAKKRRNWWPTRQAVFDHYRSKKVFGRWSDKALWDYVRHGTVRQDDGGVRLFYPPAWEARIYALPPTGVWELIPQIEHRLLAIRGQESDTLREDAWLLWQRLQPEAEFKEFQASGHLLPMERPRKVADEITSFSARLWD